MNTSSFMGAQPEMTCPAGQKLSYNSVACNRECKGKCKQKISGASYGNEKSKYDICVSCVMKMKEDTFKDPVLVEGDFVPKKIVNACNYTAVLTEEGDLYEAGILGGKRNELFTKCHDFNEQKVRLVSGGTETCWVVLEDNSVYYKGVNKNFHFPVQGEKVVKSVSGATYKKHTGDISRYSSYPKCSTCATKNLHDTEFFWDCGIEKECLCNECYSKMGDTTACFLKVTD
jgi:hypothetical protein